MCICISLYIYKKIYIYIYDASQKDFQDFCIQVLNSLAPVEVNHAGVTQAPLMNKELQKVIMISRFLKDISESN